MKYLIGNWKSNYNLKKASQWIETVKPHYKPSNKLEVVLCPSFIHLNLFKDKFPSLTLGSQYISSFPNGAYTGQVSSDMISDLVKYAIVGHSERRRYIKESYQDILNQTDQAISSGITPIIAVEKNNWHAQLSITSTSTISKSIIMYEPPEAISQPDGKIGKGNAAPIKDVIKKIKEIREEFSPKAVIYGGSVKSHNIVEFISHPDIDGVLPGSASLNPEEWIKMIQLSHQALS